MKVDVLVAGGGPAGIGAALAAARHGAITILVEDCAFFGGVAAWSCGMPINQMRPAGKARSHVHERILKNLVGLGEQAVHMGIPPGATEANYDGSNQVYCNVEYLKVAVLNALDAAGCKYLVHCQAVEALTDGDVVRGAVVATKRGMMSIHSDVVVDCTGDADVAYFAGAETMTETGSLSPMTLLFNTANVSPEQVTRGMGAVRERMAEAKAKYPLIPPAWGMVPVANSHFFHSNHAGTRDLGQLDASDPRQLSEAECLSRRQVVQIVEAMREFGGEALSGIELVGAGPRVGVRESRRVKGVYILTEEDAKNGARFNDAVAWRSGNLDIGHVRAERMKIHDVPYRALLPERIDGLLTAGRSISATHVAASAGKSMGNCVATGHAAGIAAAICARNGKTPRELDVACVQDALAQDGVDLDFSGKEQGWL